tara:strand:- start:48 stop:383 length:336 start_codon:yes stop_codon:yes gene_type:complete
MKLQLKRSNVVTDGLAKEPTASQLDYGELAVNYSSGDPVIFMKDSNNAVIRISGAGAPGGGGGAGNGLEQIDNGDNTFNLQVKAVPGYGVSVVAEGVRLSDDWSAIPSLPA